MKTVNVLMYFTRNIRAGKDFILSLILFELNKLVLGQLRLLPVVFSSALKRTFSLSGIHSDDARVNMTK